MRRLLGLGFLLMALTGCSDEAQYTWNPIFRAQIERENREYRAQQDAEEAQERARKAKFDKTLNATPPMQWTDAQREYVVQHIKAGGYVGDTPASNYVCYVIWWVHDTSIMKRTEIQWEVVHWKCDGDAWDDLRWISIGDTREEVEETMRHLDRRFTDKHFYSEKNNGYPIARRLQEIELGEYIRLADTQCVIRFDSEGKVSEIRHYKGFPSACDFTILGDK